MNRLIVVGMVNLDINARSNESLVMHDSNPGVVTESFGGVGFNIARNLHNLGLKPEFITGISDDSHGERLIEYCRKKGLDIHNCQIIYNSSISKYLSVENESGELVAAICQADIMDRIDIDQICSVLSQLDETDMAVLDTNYSRSQLEKLAGSTKARIIVDPISTAKCPRIETILDRIDILKPNRYEANRLTGLKCDGPADYPKVLSHLLNRGVSTVIVSLGREGLIASNGKKSYHVSAAEVTPVSVSGAGDGFLSGYIYGLRKGFDFMDCLLLGSCCAIISLKCAEAVDENLSSERLMTIYEGFRKQFTVQELVL